MAMSRLIAFLRPHMRATWLAPMTPDAVPESSICTEWRLPSSALITPPFDFVMSGAALTPASLRAASSEAR